jgi:aryl-alcohol dehydrogenase-like predicted oxidoreductase
MKYRNLGNTGLRVSELSLGSYMTYGQANDERAARDCIKKAMDIGINSFDTADVYGNRFGHTGSAEELLGSILSGYRRGSYVIATKAGYPVHPDENGKGLSRKHLLETCDESLRRLRTDYIDIYYMHLADSLTPLEETLDALDYLVRAGKVLYTGVSSWSIELLKKSAAIAAHKNQARFAVMQIPYNMFDRTMEKDMQPYCAESGLGIAAYFPLAQGVLAGRYSSVTDIPVDSRAANSVAGQVIKAVGCLTEENLAKVQRLKQIASDCGLQVSQLALAWILRFSEVSTILVGASQPSQLETNAGASGIKLDTSTLSAIDTVLGEVQK